MLNRAPAPQYLRLGFAICVMAVVSSACVSDYRGYLGHKTDSEAKLWGQEGSILSEPDPDGVSGTYAPTVKYDFRGYRALPPVGDQAGQCPDLSPDPANPPAVCTYPSKITIIVYKNPTVGAFSREGCVDRDGDDIQGRYGIDPATASCDLTQPSPTKYEAKYRFIDGNLGCQFFANYDQTFGSPKVPPGVAVCFNSPSEEIDRDLTLQGSTASNVKEAFTSIDDLMTKIWSGALARNFRADLTGVTVNGSRVDFASAMPFALGRNSLRVTNYTLDFTTPGGKELIRAVLANSESGARSTVTLHFAGGMNFTVPSSMILTFNHEALKRML